MLTYISWSVASLGNIDSQCLDKCLSFVISPALTVSLDNIDSLCLDKCLSFVISPALTVFICAVSASISAAARRSSSWFGMVVDASGRRPTDKAAMIHFKNWPYIKAVLAGNCERGGLSFPVDGTWVAFVFVHLQGVNASALVSCYPIQILGVLLVFVSNREIGDVIFVGIATDTGCHAEITSALQGRPSRGIMVAAVLSNVISKASVATGGRSDQALSLSDVCGASSSSPLSICGAWPLQCPGGACCPPECQRSSPRACCSIAS